MTTRTLLQDDGLGLAELVVAMFISAIVVGGMVTWASHVSRATVAHNEILATIDELQLAKGELVKEVRFADAVYPPASGDDSFSFWLDEDASGIAEIGETVTISILADGTLQRATDDLSDPTRVVAIDLDLALSAFVVTGNIVDVTMAIDRDPGDSLGPRTIHTTINARNA